MGSQIIRDAQVAFQNAIDVGILSAESGKGNYAGNYMYMFSDASKDHFKNSDDRTYRACEYLLERTAK